MLQVEPKAKIWICKTFFIFAIFKLCSIFFFSGLHLSPDFIPICSLFKVKKLAWLNLHLATKGFLEKPSIKSQVENCSNVQWLFFVYLILWLCALCLDRLSICQFFSVTSFIKLNLTNKGIVIHRLFLFAQLWQKKRIVVLNFVSTEPWRNHIHKM